MNIIIDIRSLLAEPKTGVGEYVFELLSAIFRHDTENNYFLFYNAFGKKINIPDSWNKKNVFIIHTRYPNKLLNLAIFLFHAPGLDKLVEKKTGIKADIFFAPHINFTALSKDIKSALTIHDLTFELYPYFFSRRQRIWHRFTKPQTQIKRASLIFTPSDNTRNDLIKSGVAAAKIQTVYPGIAKIFLKPTEESDVIRIKNKYELDKKYILFLGTLEPRKNLQCLIRGFEFAAAETDCDLIIAGGDGYQSGKIKKMAARSPVYDRIKFIGYVPDEDKPALYRGAEIFVYPSFYEGFGFPILEAKISGTPIIASTRGSLPEIAGNQAIYTNPHRPETLAQAINKILKNKKNVDIATLREKFNWDRAAEKIMNKFIKF